MDEFSQDFLAALRSTSDEYRRLRSRLLSTGAQRRNTLLRAPEESRSWQAHLLAEILLGWLDRPDLYQQVILRMRGIPEPRLPDEPDLADSVLGEPTAFDRALAITALGSDAVPRILEILLFSKGYSRPIELAALHASLQRLCDSRSVDPLIDQLRRGTASEREFAADSLAWLKEPRSFEAFLSELEKADNGDDLRRLCMTGLVLLRDQRALEPMLAITANREESQKIRAAAASGVSSLGNPAAGPALLSILVEEWTLRSDQTALLRAIAGSLGALLHKEAVPLLREIASTHPDSHLRAYAGAVEARMRERLEAGETSSVGEVFGSLENA